MPTQELNSPSVTVGPANPDDAEAIRYVMATTWLDTYPNPEHGITEEDIRHRLEGDNGERVAQNIEKWREIIKSKGPESAIYVARLYGKIVGMAAAGINKDNDNKRSLTALYVLPEAQGHGVGSQLMQTALDWLGTDQDIYVVVASYNEKAINFYGGFGFTPTGKEIEDFSGRKRGDKEIPEIEMVRKA